ncbi:hypothetical protein PROFUN_14502 [Planoprotostelium fungivorum]|uniref:Uncharacterized protein n=1 Tax=Planoprotostelium fungivorum TaxID=1890364 RepID=A0A2P6MZG3_9EUKA|nr:hypothetical protein PROFUN_14502 [Planoprotostelium fungivorum]
MLSGQLIRKREAALIPYSSEKALYCGMDGACRLRLTERVICPSCCCDACSDPAVGHLLTSISEDLSPYILELTQSIYTRVNEIKSIFILFALAFDFTQIPTEYVMRSRHRISEPSYDVLYQLVYYIGGVHICATKRYSEALTLLISFYNSVVSGCGFSSSHCESKEASMDHMNMCGV